MPDGPDNSTPHVTFRLTTADRAVLDRVAEVYGNRTEAVRASLRREAARLDQIERRKKSREKSE